MATIIDNIELDESNVDFNYASDFVQHTNKLVYLTGKAGTGKTTFLKYLKATTSKNTVILAPTGVAAINAGGQTIHSFFQIKPSVYVPNDKRLRTKVDVNDIDRSTIYDHFKYFKDRIEIIKGLELLIIDEVSMVRCDLLDVVDRLLRVFRKRENEPFGGVQVILIGDTFQLPPIADFDQWEILKSFYESPFFFSSKIIRMGIEKKELVYIELKKIYRQNEQEFIDLLNRIRINQVTNNELNLLNTKYNPTFENSENSNYITLATHNRLVDSTNLTKLGELPSELKLFEATVTGLFPDNIMPTDKILNIKDGAQIMFIKNDKSKRYHNGKIAKISKIDDNRIIVEFSDGNEITVEKQEWDNIKYTWNEKEKKIEEEIIGTFIQFPIKLAWAITVHKSQGLTFERVIADLGAAFASGQVYVALSRCTTFNGLILKTRIGQNAIMTAPEVLEFAQNETPNTLIVQELNSGKADFYYKKAREALANNDFDEVYDNFIKALKFRNDIETSTFKRYFVSISKRLAGNKQMNSKMVQLENDNLELKNELKETRALIDKKNQKLEEQNNSLKIIIDENEKLMKRNQSLKTDSDFASTNLKTIEASYEKIKRQNSDLVTSVNNKDFQLKRLKKDDEKKEQEIINQNITMSYLKSENKYLKNLKWYQKLFNNKQKSL